MQILNNEGGTYAANIVQDASGGPAMAEDFKPIYDAFAPRVSRLALPARQLRGARAAGQSHYSP